ncbi:MAG: magnesium transporter [Acidiferrobacterales bacterium]
MPNSQKTKSAEHRKALFATFEDGSDVDIRESLAGLHPADIADVLEAIPPELRRQIWQQVDHTIMGEILLEMPQAVRSDLIRELDDEAIIVATQALDTDEIADLIPHLSDDVISRILLAMDSRARESLDRVLSYPEDTAGGLMNVDAVTIRDDISLEVVLRYLRRQGDLPEYTNKLFVVDRAERLVGSLLVSRLLTADPAKKVTEVMETEDIKFSAMDSDKDVAAAFEKYNLITAPVLNDDAQVIGRITVDDVVDVIRDEADHSIMAPAGLKEDEDIFAPVARSTRNRAVWLGVNLITAVLASWVISLFEQTIQQVVALAVLMPIVASMGGNAGTQTVTLVIRGIALGTIDESNARRVLRSEFLIGVMNSVIWAVVIGIVALLWFGNAMLGLVIGMAMTINLVIAALSGVIIPLLIKRMGIDPALASGVALTTVTDVIGFFVFLGLATLLLL